MPEPAGLSRIGLLANPLDPRARLLLILTLVLPFRALSESCLFASSPGLPRGKGGGPTMVVRMRSTLCSTG